MKHFHWNFSLSTYPEIGRSALFHFLENTYIHTTLRNQEKVQGVHVNLVPRGKAV